MADITPIRGLRYTARAGPLSDLVTPPYDVIDEVAQERYYQRRPYNIIRLEYGKTRPGDTPADNRYTRAAADFLAWQKEGVLAKEPVPALYRYEQTFPLEGMLKTRRGLICGVKLEPYAKGVVLPHEETLPNHKADRLALMRACRANFSPIFGLFADPEGTVEQCLTKNGGDRPPDLSFADENGHQHNLWVITEPKMIAEIRQALASKRIYIADGHHRYETALRYRDERRARGDLPGAQEHPVDFVLMTLVNLYDPGLVILPTHRLVRNVPDLVFEKLLAGIKENFIVERFPLAPGKNLPAFFQTLRERGEAAGRRAAGGPGGPPGRPHVFGLYGQDRALYMLTLKEPFAPAKATGAAPGRAAAGRRELDVTVLHTLILERRLGIGSEQLASENYVTYTRDEREALAAVDRGEAQLAFFLNPTLVEEVLAAAAAGEKMPQKSTYFYPKLITGLVINPLE